MELYNRCKNMFYDYTIDLLNGNEIITEKLAEEYFTKNIIPKSKNAHERAFMMFSHLEKTAIYNDEDETYTINIKYYHFDEGDIIKDILSLGPYAEITYAEETMYTDSNGNTVRLPDPRSVIKKEIEEAYRGYEL